jgi:hypothetical protein
MLAKLRANYRVRGKGLGRALWRRQVNDMDQHPAALHMGEELVAEAGPMGSALDQARDIGENQLAIIGLEGAEDGVDGREGVVGDLRSRPG